MENIFICINIGCFATNAYLGKHAPLDLPLGGFNSLVLELMAGWSWVTFLSSWIVALLSASLFFFISVVKTCQSVLLPSSQFPSNSLKV